MGKKNDLNNLFNLAIGAVVGVIIYNVYKSHLDTHAYAVEAEPINCDRPRPWNAKELHRFKMMTDTERANYLKTRETEFKRLCKAAERAIYTERFDDLTLSPGDQNLKNPMYDLRSGGDPLYPQRKHGSKGTGLEYPVYEGDGSASFAPSLPSQFGGNQAAFALAYAAAKKKKKAKGGAAAGGKAKGGGGKAAKGGADAPADSGGDAAAPATDTPPVDSNSCDCTCKPMDSDPSRFKIETAAGEDCYNHVYPPSMAECQTALKEVCAKRSGGAAAPADAADSSGGDAAPAAADKPAKGGKAKAAKGGGGGKASKSAAYVQAYAAYRMAYAAAKKAAKPAADTPAPAASKTPAAAPSGGGGGAASTGKFPYPPTGKQWQFKDSGKSTRHYASGGSSGTSEWNAAGVGAAANLMGVVYYTHPSSCSGGHGDEADIKMWGPAHSAGACCWCIVNINGKGDVCTGGEGPHPKTTKCRKVVGNVGPVAGKRIGLLHAIWKAGSGAHSEVWIDTGSGFKKVGAFDGACGNAKTATTPSAGQQVQFRCDCTGVKVESAVVYEIAAGPGGGGAAPAGASKGGAGKTAAAGYITNNFQVTLA